MERLLQAGLTRFIRHGNLRLAVADEKPLDFGDGTGTPVSIRFRSPRAVLRVLLNPELRFGEAYMARRLYTRQAARSPTCCRS